MKEKIELALKIAEEDGLIDGAHHEMWVIDQMIRALLVEEDYYNWVKQFNNNAGEEYPHWDIGIAP